MVRYHEERDTDVTCNKDQVHDHDIIIIIHDNYRNYYDKPIGTNEKGYRDVPSMITIGVICPLLDSVSPSH